MKNSTYKLLSTLAILLLALAACQDGNDFGEGYVASIEESSYSKVSYTKVTSPTEIILSSPDETDVEIDIESNEEWNWWYKIPERHVAGYGNEATLPAMVYEEKYSGNRKLTYNIPNNSTSSQRILTAKVTGLVSKDTTIITITQPGINEQKYTKVTSPTEITLSNPDETDIEIDVESNEEWDWWYTFASEDAGGGTIGRKYGGKYSGNMKLTYNIPNNSSSSQRIFTVKVCGYESKDTTTVTITQPSLKNDVLTFTANGVSFKMILVEAGTFTMGATAEQGDEAYNSEKPAHSVTLTKDYYIGETEVTQALWYAVMGQKPTSDGSQWTDTYGLGDKFPAYYVSRDDCQAFISKLNQLTGKTFRLPTEAEWEFAARGGNKSKGYKYAGSNSIDDVAWFTVNSYDKGSDSPDYGTHNVATKQANELGIYDMSGNVWEWCSDWYGGYSSSAQTNPTGPTSGSNRVRRGGGWSYGASYCRVSSRYYWYAGYRNNYLGLRLAL